MTLNDAISSSPWPILQGTPPASESADVLGLIAPHPDDEAIGPGGCAILEAQKRGVIIFYLTEGARGISGQGGEGARRRGEAEACVREMGAAAGVWLGFSSEDVKSQDGRVRDALTQAFAHFSLGELWIPSPYEHHKTHVSTTLACMDAIAKLDAKQRPDKLYGYGVWDPIPEGADVERRIITSVMEQKKRSILVHESQCQIRPLDEAIFGLNRYEGLFQETTGGDGTSEWSESLLDMSGLIGQGDDALIQWVQKRLEDGPIGRIRNARP